VAELACGGVVGLEQRSGRGLVERLEPEGAGDAQQRALDPVAPQQRAPRRRLVSGRIEPALGLVAQAQHPAATAAADERRLAAPVERGHERIGPEVLMDVGGSCGEKNTTMQIKYI
jgi:hypothetical protein